MRDQSPRMPNFLIIGAMRSGTTFLARCLASHPDIFVASGKELHFFDVHFEKGPEWYQRKFSQVRNERAIGEATQSYMYLDSVVPRMVTLLPNARLIAILRNPVDRAYSHYWFHRALGIEKQEFLEAIAEDHKGPPHLSKDGRTMLFPYLDRGRYVYQLQKVSQYYPKERLKVVLLEDFRSSPEETYRSLCNFLGVEENYEPPDLRKPANKYLTFRSLAVRRFLRPFPKIIRNMVGRLNVQKSSYPRLDPAVRRSLLERFEIENKELEAWLGRDLSIWQS